MNNVIRNMKSLMDAAIAELKAAGWTDAQIIPQLPMLATEALNYLNEKGSK